MGDYIGSDNIVMLFDNYRIDSQKLHTSFKQAGKNYPVAGIEDDGFLPDELYSLLQLEHLHIHSFSKYALCRKFMI